MGGYKDKIRENKSFAREPTMALLAFDYIPNLYTEQI